MFITRKITSTLSIHKISPVGIFATGDLHFNSPSIFGNKMDIFFIKDCDKINQAIPLSFIVIFCNNFFVVSLFSSQSIL